MGLLRLLISGCALLCAASPSDETIWKELLAQAENLKQEGRYEEARRISGQALRTAEQIDHSGLRVAVTLNQIGLLHSYSVDYSQAEKAYLHGIRLFENCACESLRLSRLLDDLASLYLAANTHRAQVERLRRRALDLRISELGPEHPDVGILLSNLGATAMIRRRFPEAQTLYQRALTILEAHPGPYAANIAGVLANRAVLSFYFGRFPDALNDLTRAVAMYEKALGVCHPELVRPLINLAGMYLGLDRAALAEAPLRRAMSIAATTFGPEHPILAEALSTYAIALRKTGKKRESREAEKRVQAIHAMNPHRTASMTVHISDLLDSRDSSQK